MAVPCIKPSKTKPRPAVNNFKKNVDGLAQNSPLLFQLDFAGYKVQAVADDLAFITPTSNPQQRFDQLFVL